MSRETSVIAAVALLLTGACGFGVWPTTPPPPRATAVPHPSEEGRVLGYNRAIVRTTLNGIPATGATCRMIAPTVSLDFHTPAEIALPVMHRPLAPAEIVCRFGDTSGTRLLHADRKLEPRDETPDVPFGFVLGKAAALASDLSNTWVYVRNGQELTIPLSPRDPGPLSPQPSGGIE